jgi:DNA invertase Pin-like site-specific DNA recombinase
MNPTDIDKALERLSVLADSRRDVNEEIDTLVLALRFSNADGYCASSWQEIADALGVARQTVWRAYRAVDYPL